MKLSNFKFQRYIVGIGILLFAIKIIAWYFTQSVAVLTDALESIVNVMSAGIGLYSLYLSSLPKDKNHPYGHGKVEFISAAIEGTLISVAGLLIIFETIYNLGNPHLLSNLDLGIGLIAFTAVANFILGHLAEKKGKLAHSLALEASGKHLKTDTYTTAGIILGLFLVRITGIIIIDRLVAFIFAGIILFTGYKILRNSIKGIMDEADENLIQNVVIALEKHRKPSWIDVHNLRFINYSSTLHLDCHVTVPYYFTVSEAHQEIEEIDTLINAVLGNEVELFIHTDPCMPFSCAICQLSNCPKRHHAFEKKLRWELENISENRQHNKIQH
jgi:cation diffusion facilitator family transporter